MHSSGPGGQNVNKVLCECVQTCEAPKNIRTTDSILSLKLESLVYLEGGKWS